MLTAALVGLPAPDDLDGSDLRAIDLDSLGADEEADVLVVRAARPADLAALQRAHTRFEDATAVLVVGPDDVAVRRALRYTPGIPGDLEVLRHDDAGLVAAIRAAAQRTRQQRRHRAVLAAVSALPHDPRPSLRPSSESLGAVLDHAPLGVVVATVRGELMSWNRRAAAMLGLGDGDPGTSLSSLFADPSAVLDAVTASATTDAFSPAVTADSARRPEVAIEVNAVATELDDGRRAMLLLLVDVSVRRAAEAARDELRMRLEVVRRSQEFLLRASDVLAAATGYAETLRELAAIAVPTLGELCLIDVVDGARFRRVAAQHADPRRQPLADELRARYAPRMDGEHPAARTVREGGTHWSAEIPDELLRRTSQDARHYEILRELDFTGYIAVPLTTDGETLGILTVVACGPGRRFGPDDVVLVEELAGRVALVVDKARRYDREHEVAVALQRSMLPALPDLTPWEVAARYAPAAGDIQVGGDWYDVFVLPGSPPAVVIGDVVGHDLEAAGTMGQLRNAVRALAQGRAARPADVMTALDELNAALRITDFATVLYGILESSDGRHRLCWSNAGHPPPVLLEPDGTARFMNEARDVVVGLPATRPRSESRADLPPGSTLLLYTDGLVERRHRSLADGMRLLGAVASELAGEPLEALCDTLLDRLARDSEDDVALLAVRAPDL